MTNVPEIEDFAQTKDPSVSQSLHPTSEIPYGSHPLVHEEGEFFSNGASFG